MVAALLTTGYCSRSQLSVAIGRKDLWPGETGNTLGPSELSWMYEDLAIWLASAWKVSWAPDSLQLFTLFAQLMCLVAGCT